MDVAAGAAVAAAAAGKVQMALLQSLDEHRYEAWQPFYVSSERLVPILLSTKTTTTTTTTTTCSVKMQGSNSTTPTKQKNTKTVTDRFVTALDDEVDKAVVFFLDQQGQIARDLWAMWTTTKTTTTTTTTTSTTTTAIAQDDASQQLYNHAIHLLRLVKFVDLNIRIVERVLSLHDELVVMVGSSSSSRAIQALYLAGKIGREAQTPVDHHRLSTLLYPDSLRATVGIAATVYYRYIKQQSKINNLVNMTGQSIRAVPSMSSLASFLSEQPTDVNNNNNNNNNNVIHEEKELECNDDDDDEDDDDNAMPSVGDMRMLALTEQTLKKPVTLSAYSLGSTEDKLVGGVLLRIDTSMTKLTKTSSMMEYLALPDLVGRKDSFISRYDSTDDLKGLGEILQEHQNTVGMQNDDKSRRYSSWLNLSNSFLYMVSYYLVAPTSSAYAKRLGLQESMSGAIIGMTAVAAIASTVLYSFWTSHSYKHALIFSSVCCLIGNLIYAAGLPFDSLTLVLVGRLLNGFGSARAINRRFIADAFSKAEPTAASADFVASGAAGMSVGPGLAAVMPFLIPHHHIHSSGSISSSISSLDNNTSTNLWWQEENAAGWVMAGLWAIYLAFLIPYFQDPPKPVVATAAAGGVFTKKKSNKSNHALQNSNGGAKLLQSMYNGEQKPLLPKYAPLEATTTTSEAGTMKETPLWERPAALITIFLVFLLKLVLELVLSAAAPVTGLYFLWTPSVTGWFLAALGLLVLPAIWLVTWAAKTYEDRYLILYSVAGTLLGCIIMLQYTSPLSYSSLQYMIGTILLFIFPNTMEAPTMSLLSKNIPSSLSRGLFNLGFFTTEAGFSGRVVADSVLTWCGSTGTDHLVNRVFGFLTLLNAVALAIVYWHMSVLVDPAKKFE